MHHLQKALLSLERLLSSHLWLLVHRTALLLPGLVHWHYQYRRSLLSLVLELVQVLMLVQLHSARLKSLKHHLLPGRM